MKQLVISNNYNNTIFARSEVLLQWVLPDLQQLHAFDQAPAALDIYRWYCEGCLHQAILLGFALKHMVSEIS
jgi:predicted Co/Zn/Cd cation transporter (cation efflux family)